MATQLKKMALKKKVALSETDIAQKYQKLSQLEHIIKRPGMYVGQVETITEPRWLFENDKMVYHNVTYSPGLYKILDEIVVNAWDQQVRHKNTKKIVEKVGIIDISVNKKTGEVSIMNDGKSVEVAMHPIEKIYVPELIFGKLMSGSNFNDDEDRVTGGCFGLGSKLTNVFSSQFKVETYDMNVGTKYEQTFEKNMSIRNEPILTLIPKGTLKKEYTKISFIPDFQKFNITQWSDDMISIIHKRALEVSACCGPEVSVYFNKTKIKENTFEKFCRLFLNSSESSDNYPDISDKDARLVYERNGERWEIGAALSDGYKHVSYVNGIYTSKGGKHVEYITNALCKKLADLLLKKHKITVKATLIKEHIIVFVNCLVVNPTFDSQTKDFLTTPVLKFGSKCEISDKFVDKLAKTGVMENIVETYNFKENKLLKKTDGKKKNKIYGIPKLDDANEAGGKNSNKCTLILTEGDSAKAMAVAGLSVVGRDNYGVFPLRGKVINVREKIETKQGREQVMNNIELNHMKQILGLEQGVKYKNTDKLRYGHVMIMTDQDVDGSHIKGLIMNWLGTFWPELLEIKGFVQCMLTPIVKVTKNKITKSFYCLYDFEEWKKKIGDDYTKKGWSSKYYKGLGTSTTSEAKEYFKELNVTTYISNDLTSTSLDLAFNKDRANDRKDWLKSYKVDNVLSPSDREIGFDDFVHKELIHFSNYDLQRSIPNIMDGLKISHRKILFSCFKRKLIKEIRVSQLSGYVSEHGSYHGGEASLNGAIIGMAQTFTGSNNINLLQPNGQFGTRLAGGKDAGSPRYLHTVLSGVTHKIFNEKDSKILKYLEDDGMTIEPNFYLPIIPMILCNGAQGIGTGYSTTIPLYNPETVLNYVEHKIMEKDGPKPELIPHYNGFKGKIMRMDDDTFITKGVYSILNYKTILISELPIGTWIESYKDWLDSLMVAQDKPIKKTDKTDKLEKTKDEWSFIKNYISQSSESSPHFEIEIDPVVLSTWVLNLSKKNEQGNNINFIEKTFKLTSKISTTNMHLFTTQGVIKKYASPCEIADEFIASRWEGYDMRKANMLDTLGKEMNLYKNKVRFIRDVLNSTLDIRSHTKKSLCEYLFKNSYAKYPLKKENGDDHLIDDESADSEYLMIEYNYLTSISIVQITQDQSQILEKTFEHKLCEFEAVQNTSTIQMWKADLDNLRESLSSKKIKLKKKVDLKVDM
jgi:DNA topoisomerase-2